MAKRLKSLTAVTSLLCVLLPAGCASKPAIDGTWTIASSSSGSGMSENSSTVFTFNHDGAAAVTTHINYGRLAMDDTSTGSYTIDGDRLIVTMTQRTIGLDAATQQALNARLHQIKPDATAVPIQAPHSIALHDAPTTYTIALSDNDNTLTLTPTSSGAPTTPGQAIDLHRVKQ